MRKGHIFYVQHVACHSHDRHAYAKLLLEPQPRLFCETQLNKTALKLDRHMEHSISAKGSKPQH